jgi:hypothetical protein
MFLRFRNGCDKAVPEQHCGFDWFSTKGFVRRNFLNILITSFQQYNKIFGRLISKR